VLGRPPVRADGPTSTLHRLGFTAERHERHVRLLHALEPGGPTAGFRRGVGRCDSLELRARNPVACNPCWARGNGFDATARAE
jgi:hypothetical protein